MQVAALPSQQIQLFISSNSRFYDGMFRPYKKDSAFWIAQSKTDTKKVRVTTKQPAADEQILFKGKAPLYTLFVQGDINPNNKLIAASAGISKLPVGDYWALENVQYTEVATVDAFLNENAQDLLKKIKAAHDAWRKSLNAKDPFAVSNAMGPFEFVNQLQPILLVATSEADIKNGNYVYTSDFYPGEFLVMSNSETGSDELGQEFVFGNAQRYAISLSSGNVYDSQKGGVKVGVIKNLQQLTKKAQAADKFLPALATKIEASQKIYVGQMSQQLYGPDTAFGQFQLYINADDLQNGQFVYANVTGLGNPLLPDGSENKQVMSQVKDYFVCVAERPELDEKGKEVRDHPATGH